jgi:hypothetical protein
LAKTAAATTRPTAVAVVKTADVAMEQVRGMKVRSSVKKLCEGCKVRFSVARLFFGEMGRGGCLEGRGLMRYSLLGGREERRGRDMCISSAR